MNDKVLVRLYTYDESNSFPCMIKAFYSNNASDLLKIYLIAKESELRIQIPEEIDGRSKYDGCESYIDDIKIRFGGAESIPTLDLYITGII